MPTARARLGHRGEEIACQFLREQGYQILTTNYRCPRGELDIVARQGEELVFVEVRTRRNTSFGTPQESLTARKRQHLMAAAQDYLQRNPGASANWRLDLVCITLSADDPSPLIDHLPHAIEE